MTAVLCYEVVLPAALLATALLGVRHRISGRQTAGVLAPLVAAGVWVATHPLYPLTISPPSLIDFLDAHFGDGLVSTTPLASVRWLVVVAILAGGVACLLRAFSNRPPISDASRLVVVGAVVLVIGGTGWWTLGGLNPPLGALDRINALTSVGASCIVVGAFSSTVRGLSTYMQGLAAVVVGALLLWTGLAGLRSWGAASADVQTLLDYLSEIENPATRDFVVGPLLEPARHHGVVALGTEGFADPAFQLTLGPGPGSLRLVDDPQAFAQAPGTLISWADALGGDNIPDGGPSGSPTGAVDTVRGHRQAITVEGWAIDPSDPTVAVDIDVRANGRTTRVSANKSRPDIAELFPAGGDGHGFRARIAVEPGLQMVCIIARNTGQGIDTPLPAPQAIAPRSTYCVPVPD